jgi:F-type H+/Na+-transporting ATPase subunit alpha
MTKEKESVEKSGLEDVMASVNRAVEAGVNGFSPTLKEEEVGRVISVGQGIVWADGLGQVKSEELVTVSSGYSAGSGGDYPVRSYGSGECRRPGAA